MPVRASLILPLLSQALALGREAIQIDGVLYPFALYRTSSGGVEAIHPHERGKQYDLRQFYGHIARRLQPGITEQAISAVAVVVDAMLPESFGLTALDAIRVLVEAPGYAKFVYLPYNRIERKIRVGASELPVVSFGAQISAPTKARYFVAT